LSEERVERRLAVILAADVSGYSRLMGRHTVAAPGASPRADRPKDRQPQRAHRQDDRRWHSDRVSERGRSRRCGSRGAAGDGQTQCRSPEDNRIEFRVGINLGDVIVEGGDIFGDGVNIAARLEGIAAPGEICISDDAFRHVQGKVDAEFYDGGEQQLKNIARPVRVYHSTRSADCRRPTTVASSSPLPDKPSIAVLPFQNLSGDPEQEYFADGMVEEIITALSRICWLFVIARNSSFTYRWST